MVKNQNAFKWQILDCVCSRETCFQHGTVKTYLSRLMTKPAKWHVCPAKTQISLGIPPVWSESSLSAWRKFGSLATHWAHSADFCLLPYILKTIWCMNRVFAVVWTNLGSLTTRWAHSEDWSDWSVFAAKTLIRLGGCPGWSESSLGAQSFCWFCHEAAHLFLHKIWFCVFYKEDMLVKINTSKIWYCKSLHICVFLISRFYGYLVIHGDYISRCIKLSHVSSIYADVSLECWICEGSNSQILANN